MLFGGSFYIGQHTFMQKGRASMLIFGLLISYDILQIERPCLREYQE